MNTTAYDMGLKRGYETQMPHATAAEWDHYRTIVPFVRGVSDGVVEMLDYDRGMAAGYAQWKASHPFAVLQWGSHPDAGNDDCNCGDDFATVELATAAFNAAFPRDVAFIELDGPNVHAVRANPAYRPQRRSNDEWRQEAAMQAGMAFGCDGFNDEMGY